MGAVAAVEALVNIMILIYAGFECCGGIVRYPQSLGFFGDLNFFYF
jgi:hypothetical protein